MKIKINWGAFIVVSFIGLIGLLSRDNPVLSSTELIQYFMIFVLPFSIIISLILKSK